MRLASSIVIILSCLYIPGCDFSEDLLQNGAVTLVFADSDKAEESIQKSAINLERLQVLLYKDSLLIENNMYYVQNGEFKVTITDLMPGDDYSILVKAGISSTAPRVRSNKISFSIEARKFTYIDITWNPFYPQLLGPEGDWYLTDGNPVFRWTEVLDTEQYIIKISKNSDFSDTVFQKYDIDTTFYELSTLETGYVYYWKVACQDAETLIGPWSKGVGFRFQEGRSGE